MNCMFPNLMAYLGVNFTRKDVEDVAKDCQKMKAKGYHYPEVLEYESQSYLDYCEDMDMGYGG